MSITALPRDTLVYDPGTGAPPVDIGGKATRLVQIASLGFDVPRWIAIRAAAFDQFAKQPGADRAALQVLTPGPSPADGGPPTLEGDGSAGEGSSCPVPGAALPTPA